MAIEFNPAEFFKHEQVFVARHDHICFTGKRRREPNIIALVAANSRRQRLRLSRDDLKHIFVCVDALSARLRDEFASSSAKRAPKDIGLNSAPHVITAGHTFSPGHFLQPASQCFRQADRERRPHV